MPTAAVPIFPAVRNSDDILASLAYWVAYCRQQRKLSQMELAKRTGVSVRQIGRIEHRVNAPSIIVASRVADALSVPLDKLLQPVPSS